MKRRSYLARILSEREQCALRVERMLALFDAACGFEMAAYGPEPGSLGFEPLNKIRKRQGQKPWGEAALAELIRDRQQKGTLPPDEWKPALEKSKDACGLWLHGSQPSIYPLTNSLVRCAVDRLQYEPTANPFYAGEIGREFATLVFTDPNGFKALAALVERWHGDRRNDKAEPLYLRMTATALDLWRKLRRNPSRAELLSACVDWLPKPIDPDRLRSDSTKPFRRILAAAKLEFLPKT